MEPERRLDRREVIRHRRAQVPGRLLVRDLQIARAVGVAARTAQDVTVENEGSRDVALRVDQGACWRVKATFTRRKEAFTDCKETFTDSNEPFTCCDATLPRRTDPF